MAISAISCWFEIPALDLDRAAAFYEKLLDLPLRRETIGESDMAIIARPGMDSNGCVIKSPHYQPGKTGIMLYLNCQAPLDDVLSTAIRNGGRLVTPKTVLPNDMGCYAHIEDCEGNRIGLHAHS